MKQEYRFLSLIHTTERWFIHIPMVYKNVTSKNCLNNAKISYEYISSRPLDSPKLNMINSLRVPNSSDPHKPPFSPDLPQGLVHLALLIYSTNHAHLATLTIPSAQSTCQPLILWPYLICFFSPSHIIDYPICLICLPSLLA